MAALVGTNVGAPIVPTDTADTYPSHDANYGKGGIHHVADNTARDAIAANRRYEGLMAYAIDSEKTYQLKGGITNSDWVELSLGGSSLSLTNAANNRVLTAVDSSTINGEANLTFDGSTLGLTGALTVSSTIQAANIGAGTDNSVVVLNSAGYLKTDEIDSRVWDGTLLTLSNGVDNRVVTATSATAMNGEENLTFDGSLLTVNQDTSAGILVSNSGSYVAYIKLDSNRTTSNASMGGVYFAWNGSTRAYITGVTGDDTTNKDDSEIAFGVADGGVSAERMRIHQSGNIGFSEAEPLTALEITRAEPYITLHNDTHEDTSGGRECRLIARGEQSGGEESTLGLISFEHDGTGDDEKGRFVLKVNDGNDGDCSGALEIISVDMTDGIILCEPGGSGAIQISASGGVDIQVALKYTYDPATSGYAGLGISTTGAIAPNEERRYKTANETRTSTTTLSNDSHLTVPVVASGVYQIEGFARVTGTGDGGGIVVGMSGPSSPTNVEMTFELTPNDSEGFERYTFINTISGFGTGAIQPWDASDIDTIIKIHGVIENGSNAGTIAIQWAQETSDSDPITIHRGAYMIARRIA